VLWNITTDVTQYSGSTAVADHGKYCFAVRDSHGGRLDAWDLSTGKLAWQSEELEYPWGFGGAYAVASAYGLVYRFSYAGVYAIDWATGKIAWHFTAPAVPFEAPWYPSESFDSGAKVADGKIYVANSEHSATEPLARDWRLWCLNATTGTEIWNITGSWGDPGPMADGYLVSSNSLDGYQYSFGKGKSVTTVTATPAVVSNGATILIQGTVLDNSPAQPNTPCVSKDSMTTQMEYLHMQLPIDGIYHNATMTGVPVTLTALDKNDNPTNIGTVITSPYYGTFEMAWTPPNEGTYKIIANFAGDDSYGSSGAQTAVTVGPASAATNNQQHIAVPDYTMTIIAGVIAVIIAIVLAVAIVGIVLYRKK
jgi:outer membrane protein assembly factor BamB